MSVLVEITFSSGKAWKVATHSGNETAFEKCFFGLVGEKVHITVHENIFQNNEHVPEMVVKVTLPKRRSMRPGAVLTEIIRLLPWFRGVSFALYLYNTSSEIILAKYEPKKS